MIDLNLPLAIDVGMLLALGGILFRAGQMVQRLKDLERRMATNEENLEDLFKHHLGGHPS